MRVSAAVDAYKCRTSICLPLCAAAHRADPYYVPPKPWGGVNFLLLVLEDCVRILYPGDVDEVPVGFKLHEEADEPPPARAGKGAKRPQGAAGQHAAAGGAGGGAAALPRKQPRKPTCKRCNVPMKGHKCPYKGNVAV